MRPGYDCPRHHEPLGGVDVELIAPDEAREQQPGAARRVDRERRRRADRDERREPRRPRLLHHLDARPSADEEAEIGGARCMRAEVEPLEHHRPDDLVDGVVPADVLAQPGDPTVAVEHRRGVAGTGRREQLLLGRDGIRDARQHVEVERFRSPEHLEACGQFVELIAAAPAAARRHVAEPRRRRRATSIGVDGDDVEMTCHRAAVGAVAHTAHDRTVEHPLGETETRRQLVVVTRRPHRGGHERVVELDRHRLFDDQVVGSPLDGGRPLGADRDPVDDQPLRSRPCHQPEANPPRKTGNA